MFIRHYPQRDIRKTSSFAHIAGLQFILEQGSELEEITYRVMIMMGEFIIAVRV